MMITLLIIGCFIIFLCWVEYVDNPDNEEYLAQRQADRYFDYLKQCDQQKVEERRKKQRDDRISKRADEIIRKNKGEY